MAFIPVLKDDDNSSRSAAIMHNLQRIEERIKVLILWKIMRKGVGKDFESPRDAMHNYYHDLVVRLLDGEVGENNIEKEEDFSFWVRKKIDSIINSDYNMRINRKRLDNKFGNAVILDVNNTDAGWIFKDFKDFIEKKDSSLIPYFIKVMEGINMPSELAESLGVKTTDADYALKRLRVNLKLYLKGNLDNKKITSSR